MSIKNKIKKVKLKDIKPYKNNVKVHTPEQIQQIKKSIEDNGYIQKICISRNNTVVIGHGRLEALKLINPDPYYNILLLCPCHSFSLLSWILFLIKNLHHLLHL